jgi:hypothetical protein
MSSKFAHRVLLGAFAIVLVAAGLASTACADTVAFYEFNGANFLADSSGNGHTLSSIGDVTQVGDAASFNGGVLSATIDLRPYKQVTISWEQNSTAVTGDHIIYEHGANYNTKAGAIVGLVGSANLNCSTAGLYNIDTYTPATGLQSYSVTYDLATTNVADVVKVFQGATEIGTGSAGTGHQTLPPAAFINAMFNIGDRQGGGVVPYLGTIDNFKIEGFGAVPEPGTIVLLVTGALGLLAYAWRKHK